MEFEWDLSIDHVSVYDDKYKKTFTLTEDGDFIFTQDGYTAEYDWLDFDHICFWEPKLFKPGIIAFYNDEDDDEPEIASLNDIEVIPTFVFYKDGQAVDGIVAPDSKAKIEEFINKNLGL